MRGKASINDLERLHLIAYNCLIDYPRPDPNDGQAIRARAHETVGVLMRFLDIEFNEAGDIVSICGQKIEVEHGGISDN